MNKFITFALLAFVCVSASAVEIEEIDDEMSQFAVTTTDVEETSQIPADLKSAFEDFCISSRDWVLNDIKTSTNSMTSSVFKIFFGSVEALGAESMANQKVAVERLGKQLANPEEAIQKGEGNLNQIIADGQEKMQGQSVPFAMLTAFKTAFAATSSSVGAFVNEKFDLLRKFSSIEQIGNGLNEACSKVRSYEEELKSQLEEYKNSALGGDAKYAQVGLDQVKCTTARRLSQIEGGCKFANTLKPVVEKFRAGY